MDYSRKVGEGKSLNTTIGLPEDSLLPVGTVEDITNIELDLNFHLNIGKLELRKANSALAYVAYGYPTLGITYKGQSGASVTGMFPLFRAIILPINANSKSKIEVLFGKPAESRLLPIGGFKGIFFE